MAVPTTLVGTWEEIKEHDAELKGRQVRLSVLPEDELAGLSQRERIERAQVMIRELGERLPAFPDRALTLDDYYPDED